MPNKDIDVQKNLVDGTDKERYNEIGLLSGVYAKAVAVYAPYVDGITEISGQVTVTTAGTEVRGSDSVTNDNGFMLTAHPDNTDTAWVFSWGQDKTSGYPLQASVGNAVIASVPHLNYLGFDADVNGEKICWIKI